MGLDSVEIVMMWEEAFGIEIADQEATVLRTPRQAIDLITTKLATHNAPHNGCLTLRAFHRLRQSIRTATNVSRKRIYPQAEIKHLLGEEHRRKWERVRSDCGMSSLPGLGWFSSRSVGEATRWMVTHAAKDLKSPGEPWTRAEIRHVVRAVVTEVTCVEDYEDDDDFVYDIGID